MHVCAILRQFHTQLLMTVILIHELNSACFNSILHSAAEIYLPNVFCWE